MEQNDNGLSNERLTEQLMLLTKRVYNLEQEVSVLRGQLNPNSVPVANKAPSVVEPVKAAAPVVTKTVQPANYASVVSGQNAVISSAPAVKTPAPAGSPVPNVAPKAVKAPKQKKNMESNIGKNLMGVIASLLILLSFVLFAVFAFPLVSDPIKLVILYAISIGFGAFGIFKMNKKSSFNALFMTFAGIGVSGFYVISLIGTLVFKVIPDLGLVALILLWLVATVIISKYKSRMFMYICNVGLLVSSFLMYTNWKEILVGLIMYYIGGIVLYFLNKTDKHGKDLFWIIQVPVMSLIFSMLYFDNLVALLIIAVAVGAFFVLQSYSYDFEGKKLSSIIASQVLTLVTIFVVDLNLTDKWDLLGAFISVLLMLAVTVFGYFKFGKQNKAVFTISVYAFAMSLITMNTGFVEQYLGFVIFAIPFVVLGYVLKNYHMKYIGFVNFLLYMAIPATALNIDTVVAIGLIAYVIIFAFVVLAKMNHENQKNFVFTLDTWILAVFAFALNRGFISDYVGVILFAVMFFACGMITNSKTMKYIGIFFSFLYMIEYPEMIPEYLGFIISVVAFAGLVVFLVKKYSVIDKYVLTVLANILVIRLTMVANMSDDWFMIFFAMISIFLNLKYFRVNPVTKAEEKASVIIGYIYNAIMIIMSLVLISIPDVSLKVNGVVLLTGVPTLIINILIAIALVTINVSRLCNTSKHEMLYGIYTCLKLTIFLLVVLNRFHVVPMIISIIAIVVAIGCIVLGFTLKKKSFRIYGLVLTIVFVFKLCLVDISYDSNIMRPIGFFVAGILCLAISWIYSKIEKTTIGTSEETVKIEEETKVE